MYAIGPQGDISVHLFCFFFGCKVSLRTDSLRQVCSMVKSSFSSSGSASAWYRTVRKFFAIGKVAETHFAKLVKQEFAEASVSDICSATLQYGGIKKSEKFISRYIQLYIVNRYRIIMEQHFTSDFSFCSDFVM